jgi:hypothetical protein
MSCCNNCTCQNKKKKFFTWRKLCIGAFLCFVIYSCKVANDLEYAERHQEPVAAAATATQQQDAPRKKSTLLKIVEGNKK